MACGILVPQPGIKSAPPSVEAPGESQFIYIFIEV